MANGQTVRTLQTDWVHAARIGQEIVISSSIQASAWMRLDGSLTKGVAVLCIVAMILSAGLP